jgi:hypothetical protein
MNVTPASIELLPQVQRELEDLGAALGIVNGEIQTEERIAGNKQYEAVKPEVDRLGKKFADAFLALRTAHLEFDSFVNELEDAGGNVSTLRIRPNGLSHPRDSSGNYFYGLQEFVDAGFFSSDMAKVFD